MKHDTSFPSHSSYKDSGADWLGQIPEHWRTSRVRNLFEIKKRIAGAEGYDVLSITQQGIRVKDTESNDGQLSADYSKYQLVEVGDFAMNHMDLLTGYVDLSPFFGVTSPDYRVCANRNRDAAVDRYYLYLFQNAYKMRIFYGFGQGASQLGRWRLPTDQFNTFALPLPPYEEQQTIATFLDRETARIDELIAKQERLITLLSEKRQAVISHAVTKGLYPSVPMKDSGVEWLGHVPAHWEHSPLKRSWSVTDCKHVTAEFVEEGIPLASIREVQSWSVNLDAAKQTTHLFYQLLIEGGRKPLPGDILFSRNATVGETAKVTEAHPKFAMGQDVCLLHKLHPSSSTDFLLFIMRSQIVEAQLANFMIGSTFKRVNVEEIRSIVVAVPPFEEQCAIADYLMTETARIDALVNKANQSIELMKERRAALISAAVTGKIDVREMV